MKYVGEDAYWKSGFVQVWNIKNVKPGKYKVVAEMSFYSYIIRNFLLDNEQQYNYTTLYQQCGREEEKA